MKKTIGYIFALTLLASLNVNAALVSDADVLQQELDGLDPIIAYTSLENSGDATEIAWMNQALEDFYGQGSFDPISTITKLEFEDDDAVDDLWGDPVGTDSMGGDIHTGSTTEEDHYLVKIGGGSLSYDTFLFNNVGDLALATIGLGWMDYLSDFAGNNFDVYRLSHQVSAVPVPAAFWLFGTALIGFIGFSRRTKIS